MKSRPPGHRVEAILVVVVLLLGAGIAWSLLQGGDDEDEPALVPQWRGAATHTFLGQSAADSKRELRLLHEAGATMTRTEMRQGLLEPREGQFNQRNIKKLDAFFDEAESQDIKVLTSIGGVPCWLSSAPPAKKNGCRDPLAVGSYAPTDYERWEDVIRWQVRRWGKQMFAVSIDNEPNNKAFFQGTHDEYAQMVIHAYEAVKSVDPDLPVVLGPLAFSDANYLELLYGDGIKGHFDALGIHPYQAQFSKEGKLTGFGDPARILTPGEHDFSTGVPRIHNVLVEHGDGDKPIYIDEFGFPTCPGPLCVTDTEQAQWIEFAMRHAATWPYVEVFLIYQLRDVPAETSAYGGFGLLRHDYSPKPAWDAFRQTLRTLPGPPE